MNDDFTPRFTVHPFDYTKEYRTFFGPFFILPELNFPGSGGDEYRAAVSRMIALRKPDNPGFDARLTENQEGLSKVYRVPLHCFKRHLEKYICRVGEEAAYPEWLFQPHAKRKFRLMIARSVETFGTNRREDFKSVGYKLKPGELLADGKKRAVADLGALRTDATAWCVESIKQAWAVPFEHGNLRATYTKESTKDNLRAAFESLLNPRGIEFFYHSDDSCVSARCSDGLVYFNGDIKACDGSHRQPLFDALYKLIATEKGRENVHAPALKRAFSYLTRTLKVRNKHKKEHVRYKFKSARLYSGSVLTTTINNFANLLIAFALHRRVPDPSRVTRAQFKEAYRLAGEDVGYQLKIIDCERPEELQFLKHSPSVVDGHIEPWMGLGVYIRGFGTFKGDLPGKGPLDRRAQSYLHGVVQSRLNWGSHIFNDSFGHLMSGMTTRMSTSLFDDDTSKSVGGCQCRIPIESLCSRYNLTEEELVDACRMIAASKLGDRIRHPVFERLYQVDYG